RLFAAGEAEAEGVDAGAKAEVSELGVRALVEGGRLLREVPVLGEGGAAPHAQAFGLGRVKYMRLPV
ncbi:MAG: hypothetical protein EBU46_21395, partial [Nitrosomonadaceae bacterium]|nr:hypothetical protein [Nitrosomonadaceae bacterium]